MTEKHYAHSLGGKPPSEWQPLEVHLKNVAEITRSFADVFGAGDRGHLAGLWHDVGKYSDEFQGMLYTKNGRLVLKQSQVVLMTPLRMRNMLAILWMIGGNYWLLRNCQSSCYHFLPYRIYSCH